MNRTLVISLLAVALIGVGSTDTYAQTNGKGGSQGGSGKVVSPGEQPSKPGLPERPSSGKDGKPAEDLQELVKNFQSQRKAFLEQQEELRKLLRSGTAEQRAAVREQLREKLNDWRQAQRQHMLELREAAKEMKNNVPSMSDVVDSAKQEGRRGK